MKMLSGVLLSILCICASLCADDFFPQNPWQAVGIITMVGVTTSGSLYFGLEDRPGPVRYYYSPYNSLIMEDLLYRCYREKQRIKVYFNNRSNQKLPNDHFTTASIDAIETIQ